VCACACVCVCVLVFVLALPPDIVMLFDANSTCGHSLLFVNFGQSPGIHDPNFQDSYTWNEQLVVLYCKSARYAVSCSLSVQVLTYPLRSYMGQNSQNSHNPSSVISHSCELLSTLFIVQG